MHIQPIPMAETQALINDVQFAFEKAGEGNAVLGEEHLLERLRQLSLGPRSPWTSTLDRRYRAALQNYRRQFGA